MKPFTRQETLILSLIFIFVAALTAFNLNFSLRRARDAQRKADLGAISDALHKYYEDFGFFPPSLDGKIVACKSVDFDKKFEELKKNSVFDQNRLFTILSPCEWGKDAFRDVTDEKYPPYLATFPQDPKSSEGLTYLYLSNTKRFQLYSFLEGKSGESGFDQTITMRNLSCGISIICSFGKSFGETPLDKSIEDYENELLQRQLD